jgi:hypothetical protein
LHQQWASFDVQLDLQMQRNALSLFHKLQVDMAMTVKDEIRGFNGDPAAAAVAMNLNKSLLRYSQV